MHSYSDSDTEFEKDDQPELIQPIAKNATEAKEQLINDLIQKYQYECLPNKFIENEKIVEVLEKLKDATSIADQDDAFEELVRACHQLQNNKSFQKYQKSNFLIHAIAQYNTHVDTEKKNYGYMNSIEALLEAEQKTKAINYFQKEQKRHSKSSINYHAYQCLIDDILHSENKKLAQTLESAMKRTVTDDLNQAFTLPGMPYVTVDEALFHRRGRFMKPTALKHYKEFSKTLIDPATVMTNKLSDEQLAERDELKTIIPPDPQDSDIYISKSTNKWYLIEPSKNIAGEKRIYVIEPTDLTGKNTTKIGNVLGVWKIDREDNWCYETKPDKFIAKRVSDAAILTLISEADITQKTIPEAGFKTPITISGNANEAISRVGRIKGKDLSDILYDQHKISEKQFLLKHPKQLEEKIQIIEMEITERENEIEKLDEKIKLRPGEKLRFNMKKDPIAKEILELKEQKEELEKISKYDHAQEAQALTNLQKIKLCTAICKALQEYVHDRGMVHLDIKPENILVDVSNPDNPKVKFIDLELSAEIGSSINARGTASYMAPELRYTPDEELVATEEQDIYSLAIVLIQVLAGSTINLLDTNTPFALEIFRKWENPMQVKDIIDNRVAALTKFNDKADLKTLMPLMEYFKKVLAADTDEENRQSLSQFITVLHNEERRLSEKSNKNALENVYYEAESAREELRLMQDKKKETKANHRIIYRVIAESLNKIEKELTGDPSLIKDYLEVLNIQALKDWYAKHSDKKEITTQDVLTKVSKIIHDYESYDKKSYRLFGHDRAKIKTRYKKHGKEIKKTRTHLDRIKVYNKKNKEIFKRYIFNDASQNDVSQNQQPSNESNESIEKNNDWQTIVAELRALPDLPKQMVPLLEDGKLADLIQHCDKQIEGIQSNRLKDNYFAKNTYEVELIYRAMSTLSKSELSKPELAKTKNNENPNLGIGSLTELLNYQQKLDVLEACHEVIEKCSVAALDLFTKNNKIDPYLERKKDAYERLKMAIDACKNNHKLSVHAILAIYRDNDEDYFKFFQKKINNHGFFHIIQDSGDFFNKICFLPEPKTFIAQLTNYKIIRDLRNQKRK